MRIVDTAQETPAHGISDQADIQKMEEALLQGRVLAESLQFPPVAPVVPEDQVEKQQQQQ